MPHDPIVLAEVRAWISKAGEDLEAAEILLRRDPPLCAAASFHTQQAAEKALKAFLSFSNTPFRKIHSLVELGQMCVRLNESFAELCKGVAPISGWAIESRYPGDWVTPDRDEVETALTTVRALFEKVVSLLARESSV